MGGARSPLRIVGKGPARSGIKAARIAMRRRERLGDVGPRAEAGIDQPLAFQRLQRIAIDIRPFGLDQRRAVMREAEPGEVLENAIDEFRPAAAGVQILDAEAEQAAGSVSMSVAQRR